MHSLTLVIITSVLVLLILAALTLFISKYIKLPFTVLLVLVGFLASNLEGAGPEIFKFFGTYEISPSLIFYACLPTLIFESAYTMDVRLLQRNLVPVLTLAIPGLFLSVTIIGSIVWLLTPLSFMTSLLLGAILSATDPVAVISLFKELGVPKRLAILVEGESLLNDSTAIVTAKTILFIMLAGSLSASTLTAGAYLFCWEFFGGIVVGLIMTYIVGYIVSFIQDDPMMELSLTVVLAYASFIVADQVFHVSGVMAAIIAGVMMAGWGRTKISASTGKYLHNLIGFLAYIANAFIFLLVGFSIHIHTLVASSYILIVVIVAMLVSRALVIYGLVPLVGKLPGAEPIDKPYQTVMWWGGLRGAIALAIVLGLGDLPENETLVSVVMGAVLFTIIVQGLSVKRLIHWLKLDRPLLSDRIAKIEAELSAEQTTLERIPELQRGGLFSHPITNYLRKKCEEALKVNHSELRHLRKNQLEKKEEQKLLFLSCYAAEKHLYFQMFNKGLLSESAYYRLNHDIDLEIDLMRYHASVTRKTPIGTLRALHVKLVAFLGKIPYLSFLAEKLKINEMINEYEEKWGLHQGSTAVLNRLDEIAKLESINDDAVSVVRSCFQSWLEVTKRHLDAAAEQFPEFVTDMQDRLARRLLINAKIETISLQAKTGLLQQGVADSIIKEYVRQIRELRVQHPEKLILDPHELLRKVPFLKSIPKNEVEEIIPLLKQHHVASGEVIIKEGAVEDTMYFILRGVVRIIKTANGQTLELATLMAGDFFGEVALLHGVKRTATCKAVTPCLLYTLNRHDFDIISKRFPAINEAIAKEAIARRDD